MERGQALRVGAAGALGGVVNAMLCYLGWPVPIAHADFGWHIIPAGLVHGGVLAASAARSAYFAAGIRTRWRWSIALPIAWIAGYISWMPLSVSLLKEWDPDVLLWPFDAQHPFNATWGPIAYFGAVAGLLYLWLAYRGTRPI